MNFRDNDHVSKTQSWRLQYGGAKIAIETALSTTRACCERILKWKLRQGGLHIFRNARGRQVTSGRRLNINEPFSPVHHSNQTPKPSAADNVPTKREDQPSKIPKTASSAPTVHTSAAFNSSKEATSTTDNSPPRHHQPKRCFPPSPSSYLSPPSYRSGSLYPPPAAAAAFILAVAAVAEPVSLSQA